MAQIDVLVVEDDEGLNRLIQKRIQKEGLRTAGSLNGEDAMQQIVRNPDALLLLDYNLPDTAVPKILQTLQQQNNRMPPFIVMTGDGDEKIAVEMMKLGALDYIIKDMNFLEFVVPVVKRCMNELATRKQLQEAERAFRETSFVLSSVIEASPLAIVAVDPEGKITLWSSAAEGMFGWSRDEVKGMLLPIVGDDPADGFFSLMKYVMGSRVPERTDMKCCGKSGKLIDAMISIAPIFDSKKDVSGTMAIFEDITQKLLAEGERKRLEQQLLQKQKLDAVGVLAGGVAHDFNNILTTVQGYSDLLIMRMEESEPYYRDIKQIRTAAAKGASLVRQLLIFSRKQPMEIKVVDVNSVIDDLLKMLHRLIGEDITICADLDDDLLAIEADEGKIEQVIMNLAVNARDAMPAGGEIMIATRNTVVTEEDCRKQPDAVAGSFVCISVKDDGRGIAPDVMERMFEPFFTTKRDSGGTGLGLSTVYGIVKQHNGWLTVESSPDKGAEFKIFIPATVRRPAEQVQERVLFDEFRGSDQRILLVEDEESIREITSTTLREAGYCVYEAEDAAEALQIFQTEKLFDLVMSDVVLPGKTGLQLVDDLTKQQPDLRVILCSGYTDEKSQWRVIHERGYRFLEKPFSLIVLLKTIKELLHETGR